MAEETDTRGNLNIKRKRKNSRFLSCFGFSHRDDKYLPELNVCDDRKRHNSVKETIAVYNPPVFKKIDGKKQIKEVSLDRKTVKFETLLSCDQTPSFDGKSLKVEMEAGYQRDSAAKKLGREMVTVSSPLRNSPGLICMSAIAMIMAMMLMRGKISAIFYTAAWLYFLHYYRMMVNIMKSVDSKDYKKRTVGRTNREEAYVVS
ncbi:hypothetical protein MKX01_002282 [Papaver californicum]|nr:hypothetical protein MKX01_002282 [Papaver californicum]